jgi:hypothetical protein
MKLVELLAKELAEWPDAALIAQDGDTWIGGYSAIPDIDNYNNWMGKHCVCAVFSKGEHQLATDHATAIVTREMWEYERTRLFGMDEMRAAVDSLVNGSVPDSVRQLMAFNPMGYRDRIREIDVTIEAMISERAELTEKLYAEGFMLVVAESEPSEDMTDWRNWKVGDLVEVTEEGSHKFDIGQKVTIRTFFNDYGDCARLESADDYWWMNSGQLKFHSRPSA